MYTSNFLVERCAGQTEVICRRAADATLICLIVCCFSHALHGWTASAVLPQSDMEVINSRQQFVALRANFRVADFDF